MGIKIIATGVYLPETIVHVDANLQTSADESLDELFSGGGQYRCANKQETATFMGSQAALNALANGDIDPASIDAALCFSFVPDYETPRDIYGILKATGCKNAIAWSLDTACASFLSHLHLASLLALQGKRRILIIESTNWVNRAFGDTPIHNAVGDGAAAVIIDTNDNNSNLLDILEKSNVALFDFITMKEATSTRRDEYLTFSKNHRVLHKSIVIVAETAKELLERNRVSPQHIQWTLCHQPGITAINKWHELAGVPIEKNLNTFLHYGNLSAANIPVTLDHYTRIEPKINRGDLILMFTAGSGVHPVAALVRY